MALPRLRPLAAFAAAACALFVAPGARATGTRTFDLDTLEKLSGGDLKGVAVSSDGGVRAGLTLGNVPLPDASSIYASVTLADGSVLVGTSPNGKILRIAGDQATVFAETSQTAVTSLVVGANGTVYASTIPDGKIFKISGAKVEVLATLPDVHNVWALAFDAAKTALYAATGPDGKVFRVALDGSSSVYFTSTETNLISLAVGAGGKVYAGSQGKGILYEISGPGRATVLDDFTETEVKAIAVAKDGTVYAIANEYGEPPEVPRKGGGLKTSPAGPVGGARPKPGKGTLYRFDPSGRPEKMMHHDDTHYLALTLGDDGQPYVGTGAEGRVYTVNDSHAVTLVADTEEHAVGALSMDGAHAYVVGSDPGVFHRVIARGGADAVWTSKVLDCGLRAKLGVLSWTASGKLELSTRSGSTLVPDGTWSAWSPGMAAPAAVTSPAARFVQVRARWGTPQTVLTEVVLPFVTVNVRPIVTEITAAAKGFPKEPVKDMPASGSEPPPRKDANVKLTWKVDNADNDALRYRVSYRREGQAQWRDALEGGDPLTKPDLEWDTQALPEGKYRVRVEASDEAANPPGTQLANALESAPFLVDNTPPVIADLTMTGRVLRARIVDGASAVAFVAVAVDGKPEWRPIAPADGVFDSTTERVDLDVTVLVPSGSHVVAVRAFDAAGNAVTREIEAR